MGQKQSLSDWQGRFKDKDFWLATWFGSGLLKPAPGTWGSAVTVIMLYAASLLLNDFSFALDKSALNLSNLWIKLCISLVAIGLLTLAGSLIINRIEKKTGVHDAPEIVIDETAGQWVALLPVLMMENAPSYSVLWILGFLLFRLFDIWKPWPINKIDEKLLGGFGVMADDLVAGLLAAFCLIIYLQIGIIDYGI